MADDDD